MIVLNKCMSRHSLAPTRLLIMSLVTLAVYPCAGRMQFEDV